MQQLMQRSATLTKISLFEIYRVQPRLRTLLSRLTAAERGCGNQLASAVEALMEALPSVSPCWPLPEGAKGWASLQHGKCRGACSDACSELRIAVSC